MKETLPFNKIATVLLKQTEEISLEKLSILSNVPTKDIELVLNYFNQQGFLKHKDNFNKIILNEYAKGKEKEK